MKKKELFMILTISCFLLTGCGTSAISGEISDANTTEETVEMAEDVNGSSQEQQSDKLTDEMVEDATGETIEETMEDEEPVILSTGFDLQNPLDDASTDWVVYYEIEHEIKTEENDTYSVCTFKIPQLKGNSRIFSLINQDILDHYEKIRKRDEENYLLYAESMSEYDGDLPMEYYDYSYQVSLFSKKYLGLLYTDYICQGGAAHGMPERYFVMYSMETGERVNAVDLISLSKDEFNILFCEAFKELITANPDEYWESAIETVENYDYYTSGAFYLTQDGIICYFLPYELSYYGMGFVEAAVPYEDLEMDLD